MLNNCGMTDIFPLDLGDSCLSSLPQLQVRRFSSQSATSPRVSLSSLSPGTAGRVKTKRCSFSYSKSLSWGSVDSSPRTASLSTSAAILFKDSRGVPVIQPLKSPSSRSSSIDDDILNFFKCYKCYDLIPSSGKLVVLDTMLTLKKAFYAMYESGVISCPLWRSASQNYVGLVTVDDFVKIIQKNYKGSLSKINALDNKKLEDWLQEGSSHTAK